jgi:hypothetical protein|nr:MAG TPA: hypothetical protein [Caudoviricetes sp.]
MSKNTIDLDIAMRRLAYLAKRKGNADDKEAFNSVLKFINATQEYQTEKYPLLSRLFCFVFLNRYLFAKEKDEKITASGILAYVHQIVQKPLEWWIDDIAENTKMMRYETAYKDYNEALREANRIAEANKTPAEQTTSLKDEYRSQDISRIVEAKNNIVKERMADCIAVLQKEYKREDIGYFIKSEITKLLLLCR